MNNALFYAFAFQTLEHHPHSAHTKLPKVYLFRYRRVAKEYGFNSELFPESTTKEKQS
jgi:hypothetical protein